MIDLDNLRTASLYINNQLLSRGLINDGETIRFDRPGDSDGALGDTMGQIMSVVNDLILRRDVSESLSLHPSSAQRLSGTNRLASVMPKPAKPSLPLFALCVPSLCARQRM
jgi:hypothetical protein